MFHELGGAEIGLVEQFESDAAGLGKPGSRQSEPRFGQFPAGTRTVPPLSASRYSTPDLLQFLNHRGRILGRHRGVQRAKVALVLPVHEGTRSAHLEQRAGGHDQMRCLSDRPEMSL